jgi:hypothetical protein
MPVLPRRLLLRQQTALTGDGPIELEVCAYHNWLIRRNSHGPRSVSYAIESRSTHCRHHPGNLPCMRRQDRYRGCTCFSWVGGYRARRTRNRHTGQVVAVSVQDVDGNIRSNCAAVEYVDIITGTSGAIREMRRRADPNVGRSTGRGSRRSSRARWSCRTGGPSSSRRTSSTSSTSWAGWPRGSGGSRRANGIPAHARFVIVTGLIGVN